MDDDMKLEIRGYLENNTNVTNLWTSMEEMYSILNPHGSSVEDIKELTEDQIQKGLMFGITISNMVIDQEIRVELNEDNTYNVALESIIQDKINSVKRSALDEMEDELQKYVKMEEFEKAAEYHNMINEYKSKLE